MSGAAFALAALLATAARADVPAWSVRDIGQERRDAEEKAKRERDDILMGRSPGSALLVIVLGALGARELHRRAGQG